MAANTTQPEPNKPFLISIIEYVIAAEANISHEQLRDIVETELPGIGGVLVDSIANHWAEKGHMAGLQQSLAKNRDLFLEPLRYVLATRFDLEMDYFEAELTALDLPTLTRLSDAAFAAATPGQRITDRRPSLSKIANPQSVAVAVV